MMTFFTVGTAALIAQFDVDQFRSVAWFNVAFGIAFTVLQVIMFSDESYNCGMLKKNKCACNLAKKKINSTSLEILISSSV